MPAEYISRVTNPYTLYALGTMLLAPLGQKSLLIETMYGLTNRLRAYGSAKALADASSRQLIVLWMPDPHCSASFQQLFLPPKSIVVVDDPLIIEGAALAGSRTFDLMSPGQKLAPIDAYADANLYIRSAFRIQSKQPYGRADTVHIRSVAVLVNQLAALIPSNTSINGLLCKSFNIRQNLFASKSSRRKILCNFY